jgi:hypothetical protein
MQVWGTSCPPHFRYQPTIVFKTTSTQQAIDLCYIATTRLSTHPHLRTMPPSRNHRGGGGGRILLHTCDMDDSTPTMISTGISAFHAEAIFTTSDQGLTKKVCNNHRTKIRQLITFLFKNYGDI